MVLIAHSFVFFRLSDIHLHKLWIYLYCHHLTFFLEDELLENAILSKIGFYMYTWLTFIVLLVTSTRSRCQEAVVEQATLATPSMWYSKYSRLSIERNYCIFVQRIAYSIDFTM